jgi:hypothetical protein
MVPGVQLPRVQNHPQKERLAMTNATTNGIRWRTKEGRVMLLKEMDDSHLINSIKLLERQANGDQRAIALIAVALSEWKPSPTAMAMMEKIFSDMDSPVMPPGHKELRAEATRRGLMLWPSPAKEEHEQHDYVGPIMRAITLD